MLNRFQTTISAEDIINGNDAVLDSVTVPNFDISKVADLDQKFSHPAMQVRTSNLTWPNRRALSTKRVKRASDKIIVKPEMKPNTAQFLKFSRDTSAV